MIDIQSLTDPRLGGLNISLAARMILKSFTVERFVMLSIEIFDGQLE